MKVPLARHPRSCPLGTSGSLWRCSGGGLASSISQRALRDQSDQVSQPSPAELLPAGCSLLWALRAGRRRRLPTQTCRLGPPTSVGVGGGEGLSCRFLFLKHLTLSDVRGVNRINRSCFLQILTPLHQAGRTDVLSLVALDSPGGLCFSPRYRAPWGASLLLAPLGQPGPPHPSQRDRTRVWGLPSLGAALPFPTSHGQ